jgi:hypothetical protein
MFQHCPMFVGAMAPQRPAPASRPLSGAGQAGAPAAPAPSMVAAAVQVPPGVNLMMVAQLRKLKPGGMLCRTTLQAGLLSMYGSHQLRTMHSLFFTGLLCTLAKHLGARHVQGKVAALYHVACMSSVDISNVTVSLMACGSAFISSMLSHADRLSRGPSPSSAAAAAAQRPSSAVAAAAAANAAAAVAAAARKAAEAAGALRAGREAKEAEARKQRDAELQRRDEQQRRVVKVRGGDARGGPGSSIHKLYVPTHMLLTCRGHHASQAQQGIKPQSYASGTCSGWYICC